MEQLDRKMQRRVWSRVYDKRAAPLTPQQREALRRCLERSQENLVVYDKMENHRIYGDAFARMRAETTEQIKILKQMLS